MYKQSSEHLQRASFGQTAKNEAGIDPTVWASPEDQYRALRNELTKLQADSAAITTQITLSRQRQTGSAPGKPMPAVAYINICQKKSKLVQRILEIEAAMRPLKDKMHKDREEQFNNFQDAFFHMAREMLAEEVFNRIFIAAAHRVPPPLTPKERREKERQEK